MTNVRPTDVAIYDLDGEKWVQGMGGGISCFDVPGSGKNWWSLPAGTPIPAGLALIDDRRYIPNHWMWAPATTMTLKNYEACLGKINVVPPWAGPSKSEREGVSRHPALVLPEPTNPMEPAMRLEAKSHRYLLAALDNQIATMRRGIESPTITEDEQSDLANDLTLYEAIRRGFAQRGAAGWSGERDVSGRIVVFGDDGYDDDRN